MGHRITMFIADSAFVECNISLTQQLGHGRYMRFVIATGMSHGSYNKSSKFSLPVKVEGDRWFKG